MDADHELILFSSNLMKDGRPINHSQKLAPHCFLLAVRPFIGRWPEVYRVMNMIRTKRLSLICSDRDGCGRTSIITMAARYLWERSKFEGGVFHIKQHSNYANLADLVLCTLSNADIEGYREILTFFETEGQSVCWRDPSLLAVELLRRYAHRQDGVSRPVCLLLSDFDAMQFPEEDKCRFVCAFMEQFDDAERRQLRPRQIGSRLVLTANGQMVETLRRFMNKDYVHGPRPSPTVRLQHQFGHRKVEPLCDDDLIRLFLQMIRITSADVAYSRKEVRRCGPLMELFDHKPQRVKQVAEFALQTFDNNLSKQQFLDQNGVYDGIEFVWDTEDEDDVAVVPVDTEMAAVDTVADTANLIEKEEEEVATVVPASFVMERGDGACKGLVSSHGLDGVRYDGLIGRYRQDLSVCVNPPIDAHQHRQYDCKWKEGVE